MQPTFQLPRRIRRRVRVNDAWELPEKNDGWIGLAIQRYVGTPVATHRDAPVIQVSITNRDACTGPNSPWEISSHAANNNPMYDATNQRGG